MSAGTGSVAGAPPGTDVYQRLESEVRTYCRRFPVTFVRARGSLMWDATGREYIDFLAGAGSLNYGHNHPELKRAVQEHLAGDGLLQSLDLHTPEKERFLLGLEQLILRPRGYEYKVQFAGPTGSNTVEAALKIARRATGRSTVVAFTGGFHGGSLGGLSASSNIAKRRAAGVGLSDVVMLPYEGSPQDLGAGFAGVRAWLDDPGSGLDRPAAFLLETVQGEGGLRAATPQWLGELADTARELEIPVIVDDVQAGCGRTGTFFSFEDTPLRPDIVCLAKSIGGLGLPLGLVLIRPDLDVLLPGEHAGTFRGQNLSYVAGQRALEFWSEPGFVGGLRDNISLLDSGLAALAASVDGVSTRGRGLMRGLCLPGTLAARVAQRCFEGGLLVETSGPRGEVVKLLPALNTPSELMRRGLDILDHALGGAVDDARG